MSSGQCLHNGDGLFVRANWLLPKTLFFGKTGHILKPTEVYCCTQIIDGGSTVISMQLHAVGKF